MDGPAANSPIPPQRLYTTDGQRDYSIRLPVVGEAIMTRLPFPVVLGPPSVISDSAVTHATGSNYHLCFVSSVVLHADHVRVQLWVCLSFHTATPSPYDFVQSLSNDWQACLLPIPFAPGNPPQPIPATPTTFGQPLQIPGFLARHPCWMSIAPVRVKLRHTPFKRFNPPGILPESEVGRLLSYGASRAVPALPRGPHPTSSDTGGPRGTAARGPSHSLPPQPPSGDNEPPAPGWSGVAGQGFTQYAVDDSSDEDEHALYVDDLGDDDASSVSGGADLGLAGYVALLKGYSPMVTRMAEDDDWKREVARRDRMDAWFEGLFNS